MLATMDRNVDVNRVDVWDEAELVLALGYVWSLGVCEVTCNCVNIPGKSNCGTAV